MRLRIWCVVGVLSACGKSDPGADADARAGRGGTASAGRAGDTASTSGGGGAGAGGSGTSGRAAVAGSGTCATSGSGGSAGNVAHAGSDTGGAGMAPHAGTGGSAGSGDAGSAGEPGLEECGSYDVCGCGCCSAEPMNATCYYPSRGESLEAIAAADQAVKANPSCANAGCSSGTRRVCCVTTFADNGAGTYDGIPAIGAYNRITIKRTSPADRCTRLTLVEGSLGAEPFPLTLPNGWHVETIQDYACKDESSAAGSSRRKPLGGLGSVSWTSSDRCALDVDVTLFFLADDGTAAPVRLTATNLPIPGFGSGGCD